MSEGGVITQQRVCCRVYIKAKARAPAFEKRKSLYFEINKLGNERQNSNLFSWSRFGGRFKGLKVEELCIFFRITSFCIIHSYCASEDSLRNSMVCMYNFGVGGGVVLTCSLREILAQWCQKVVFRARLFFLCSLRLVKTSRVLCLPFGKLGCYSVSYWLWPETFSFYSGIMKNNWWFIF